MKKYWSLYFGMITFAILSTINLFSQIVNQWELIDTSDNYYGSYYVFNNYIAGLNENDIIVVGRYKNTELKDNRYVITRYTNRASNKKIIYSDDVGTTHRFHSVAHPSENLIVIVGDTNEFLGYINYGYEYKPFGMYMITRDGGKSWKRKTLDSNRELRSISMCDSVNGIILNIQVSNYYYKPEGPRRDSLIVTNEGWISYKVIPVPVDSIIVYYGYCIRPNNFILLCKSLIDKTSFLYRTIDGGLNWKKSSSINGNIQIQNLKIIDEKYIFISGLRQVRNLGQVWERVVFRTKDGGITWQECPNFFHYFREDERKIKNIDFCDSLNGIVVGIYGSIFRTTDGGETWNKEYAPYEFSSSSGNSNLQSVYYPNKNFAFAIWSKNHTMKCINKNILASPEFYYKLNSSHQPLNNVDIKWSFVEGATKYRLRVITENYDFEHPWIDTVLTDTSLVLNNLNYDALYIYMVKAMNDSLESEWRDSNPGFITIAKDDEFFSPDLLYPPYSSRIDNKNVVLLWNQVPFAVKYRILIENNINSDIVEDIVSDTTYHLTDLLPSAYYYVTLNANDGNKYAFESTWSYFSTKSILGTDDEKENFNHSNLLTHPIPFVNSLIIDFTNKTTSNVTVELYDILGYKIFTDNLGFLESGKHSTTIQLNENYSPGCYLVVVRSGTDVQSMKVVKSE